MQIYINAMFDNATIQEYFVRTNGTPFKQKNNFIINKIALTLPFSKNMHFQYLQI